MQFFRLYKQLAKTAYVSFPDDKNLSEMKNEHFTWKQKQWRQNLFLKIIISNNCYLVCT